MSFAKQVSNTLQMENKKAKSKDYPYAQLFRDRIFHQRQQENAVIKLERPSNLPRARSLGYKAKGGIIVVQVKVRKGSGLHRRPARGRKPKRMGVKKLTRRSSRQSMAERRAGVAFTNCEVIGSYWVGEDGKNTYFEVILADRASPSVLADLDKRWVGRKNHMRRAERGLTSSGKKSRGLKKGRGQEKNFPSQRAHQRKGKKN